MSEILEDNFSLSPRTTTPRFDSWLEVFQDLGQTLLQCYVPMSMHPSIEWLVTTSSGLRIAWKQR